MNATSTYRRQAAQEIREPCVGLTLTVKLGKRTALSDVRVYDLSEDLVAVGRAIYGIPYEDRARGRASPPIQH